MKENILVCVSNPNNVEKLVQRGKIIADAFGGDCYVLYVCSVENDELDLNHIRTQQLFQTIALKYQATMLVESTGGKKVSSIVADVSNNKNITQIILGQPVQSKFEMMLKSSLINEIFQIVEGIDIHVVEVGREAVVQGVEYDRGIKAQLVKKSNDYELVFDSNLPDARNGVFYKESSTDFLNGFFVITKNEEHTVLKVKDGVVESDSIGLE
ncbi:two-component system sensor histidine kinase KdpD [Bacillus tianshenii]|uniref:Two-component system sensor histidine kinase KdpD n=1 Tax=Sutcliffiella tianshenii TaxID=1463404 RepID=A0ABS2P1P8_9BACI|nr:histidine kinase [Bacillus tianshenii]MBM7620881.1 two-component system sensor histidine kinase KdpD [Bacillus tianshenii]